jgi:hypothetical protein
MEDTVVDKRKVYFKKYYEENKETIFKKYYEENKEEQKKRSKLSLNKIKTEDPERYKEMKKQWNKTAYELKKQKKLLLNENKNFL